MLCRILLKMGLFQQCSTREIVQFYIVVTIIYAMIQISISKSCSSSTDSGFFVEPMIFPLPPTCRLAVFTIGVTTAMLRDAGRAGVFCRVASFSAACSGA